MIDWITTTPQRAPKGDWTAPRSPKTGGLQTDELLIVLFLLATLIIALIAISSTHGIAATAQTHRR
jgi:hypothetical protein